MEEEERKGRMETMKEERCSIVETRANLAHVKQLEEQERNARVQAWKAEEIKVYNLLPSSLPFPLYLLFLSPLSLLPFSPVSSDRRGSTQRE
jgi:hypothetical protein